MNQEIYTYVKGRNHYTKIYNDRLSFKWGLLSSESTVYFKQVSLIRSLIWPFAAIKLYTTGSAKVIVPVRRKDKVMVVKILEDLISKATS